MIKLTLNELLNSIEVLKKVSDKSFPAKIAFQIARINREVNTESELFTRQREDLIRKLCDHDEDGNIIQDEQGHVHFTAENQHKFEEELTALLINNPIEINAEPLNMDDFGDIDFTPNELNLLMPYLQA